MSKVITNIYGFAQEIQRQFGCDREVVEALCERFSENVVIAGDRYAVAVWILNLAREHTGREIEYGAEPWGNANDLLEDPNIDFDQILDYYRGTNQDEVGYTYEALRESVLQTYTPKQCEEFVQRSL